MSVRTRSTARFAALALGSAIVLAGCGGGSTATGEGDSAPYSILAIMPMTGALAQQAALEVNGVKAAAAALNASGGVAGHPVEIKVVDDKLNPTEAVSLLQEELNGSAPPDLVVAGATSNEALAMLPALTRAKVLSTSGGAIEELADAAKYPYHYVVVPTATQNYERMVGWLQSQGVKTLGMAVTNDALGASALSGMRRLAGSSGITLLAESFDPKNTDLTSTLAKIQAGNPDMLLLSAYGSPAGYLLEARQKLGWTIPTIGDPSISSSNPAALVGPSALEGVRIQVLSVLSKSGARPSSAPDVIAQVRQQGDIPQTVHLATTMYDFLTRVAAAAKDSGSIEAGDLKKQLDTTPGPAGATYDSFGYTDRSHAVATTEGTFAYIGVTPLVDGQYTD